MLLLNIKNYQEVLSSHLECIIFLFPPNMLQMYQTMLLDQPSLKRLSTRLSQRICLLTPKSLSTHQDASMLEVQQLMQDLPEEKSSLILMVVGAHMEVVLSQERTPPRLIDPLLIMEDMLPSLLLLMDLLTEFWFRFHMLLLLLTHFQFTLIHMVPLRKD